MIHCSPSLFALPIDSFQAGGDGVLELSELLLLLSLIGGTIYASVSLTIQVLEYWKKNKYPPAKPGVLHRRVKPWITSARVTSRWYGLPAAKDCYLPPANGPFRSFPLLAVRLPGLLLTGAGCILLSFFRFSLLYPHSILCTRTPYCDT